MNIQNNVSLKKYNTFSIDATVKYFVEINSVSQLQEALKLPDYPEKFILGGGSNLLLTKDIEALVIYINIKGVEVVEESNDSVYVKAMAGENWHNFVEYCLDNNYGGVENLSLIPGNVGSAPIQNIGAYGVELKDVFYICESVEIATGNTKTWYLKECDFEYRSSVFKTSEKGKYIITSVTFKLSKQNHKLFLNYGLIKQKLYDMDIESPTIQDVSKVVVAIRQEKLPDPKEIGNSGSFFKNPVINYMLFVELLKTNPEAPFYKIKDNEYKIPAGWLIEQAGFKGYRDGDAGVHKNQALVLVNYKNATGAEILDLSKKIQNKVYELFSIELEPEVNVI